MKTQWRRRFYFRLATVLGFAHPDFMLAKLSSRQIGEWLAFGILEQIGNPIKPDPEDVEKGKRKAQRAKVEGGLMALRDKRG